MTTSGHALSLALAGALALLAACASAAGPAPATASCASTLPAGDASLAAAFDSLHTLRVHGRAADSLVLAPHDSPAQLANRGEVTRLLRELYPPALREAGVSGTSEVAALIDASGTVRNVRLVRGSTYYDFDRATHAMVTAMRFRPARQGGCPVPFFLSIPITWMLQRT